MGAEVQGRWSGRDRRALARVRVREVDNIRQAAQAMNVSYPIAIDSDFAIWQALRNQAWPALYFVDVQGRIRHHHFGEGDYEQSEWRVRDQQTANRIE